MRVAVVGTGMIGSAAARHLAKAGHVVTLIGPDEPEGDWAAHDGVFSSHYDEGRITRINDRRPFFAKVAAASIGRYGEIEAESGVSFFTESGALIAAGRDYMAEVDHARDGLDVTFDWLDADGFERRFPFFRFPDGYIGAHEPARAGHISPRRLVAAQIRAARRLGARLVPVEADRVAPGRVETRLGTVEADEVIVAAGGWTDMLLGRAKTFTVRPRTVALHEIGPAEAERLARMPSLVYETPNGAYVLPPIRYPDGRLWLKIGGDPVDDELTRSAEINAWFRSGGSSRVRDFLTAQLADLIPGLAFESVRMAPCVTTWTRSGLPEIERIAPGLTVASGGNGGAAKCSDELGRLAAVLAVETEPA